MTRPFSYGPTPKGWKPTRLRSFLTRRRVVGRPNLPLLSVNLTEGVVLRREGDGRPAPAEDLTSYQIVRPGDLVMNQLGKPHGSLGVSPYSGIISPAYFVAAIAPSVSPSFVHHMLRTRLYISEYERRGKFMPPSQFDISWEQFRSIEVLLPSLAVQTAIADFLDTETARIDGLIAKKSKLLNLLEEKTLAALETLIEEPFVPLRRFAVVQGGVTVDAGRVTSDGIRHPYLRVANVQDGWVDLTEISEIEVPPEVARRATLQVGDVVMTEANGNPANIGRGTVWGGQIARCLHQNHVFAIRVNQHLLLPEYLSLITQSAHGRQYFQMVASQVGIASVSKQKLLDFPIPALSVDGQVVRVERVTAELQRLQKIGSLMRTQITLLREHRQALITAAVTGQVAVSGVPA